MYSYPKNKHVLIYLHGDHKIKIPIDISYNKDIKIPKKMMILKS